MFNSCNLSVEFHGYLITLKNHSCIKKKTDGEAKEQADGQAKLPDSHPIERPSFDGKLWKPFVIMELGLCALLVQLVRAQNPQRWRDMLLS